MRRKERRDYMKYEKRNDMAREPRAMSFLCSLFILQGWERILVWRPGPLWALRRAAGVSVSLAVPSRGRVRRSWTSYAPPLLVNARSLPTLLIPLRFHPAACGQYRGGAFRLPGTER